MDQAAKDQPQIRRVKPGPKPAMIKRAEGIDCPPGYEASGDYYVRIDRNAAQSLASRIWEGQSPDLPRAERLCRVKAGVEAQGMSMEGVTL